MTKLSITYIIGTDSVGVDEDEVELIEPYRAELEERLRALYPEASVEVDIENGYCGAGVGGIDWKEQGGRLEAMLETINAVANEVWGYGKWHNEPWRG